MKILVIGSGAREHAIAWKLKQNKLLTDLFVIPGNAGTSRIAQNVNVNLGNLDEVVEKTKALKIDLVVVGPDGPLAEGIVNKLKKAGISTFGPTREAAEIEWSKSYALDIMDAVSVPHPESLISHSKIEALNFINKYSQPLVVKADGLAAGKGVWLCETKAEAKKAVISCFTKRSHKPIILQELLKGKEVSVFCFSDGKNISSLVAACDYKRLKDGNKGPNTGSMGSYAWPIFWTDKLEKWIANNIMKAVINEMARRGRPFIGVLYAGLILTKDGPKVLEFNARFGDSEAQVILPLLVTDPIEIMLACIKGELNKIQVVWRKDISCVGVVMASRGYPDSEKCEEGFEIEGLDEKFDIPGSLIFYANTQEITGDGKAKVITGKGRNLTIVGIGNSLLESRINSYRRLETIRYPNEHRNDIAI